MGRKYNTRCFLDVKIGDAEPERIVVELFDEKCPKACDNFKKLCQGICGIGLKTGKALHYQGSTFHRIIKGFIIQGGDFSNGDGTGGESIYGGTFADEDMSLLHDRPFLLSMANRGPNTNGSQFFITTAPAPHLNGKHMVFGHVLSGQEEVIKIEAVPVSDTRVYKPIKPVVIVNCGELVPVKKKKSKSAKKELKEKKRKEKKAKKKKSRRHRKPSSASSDNSDSAIIRPEEIPEVPQNKFLYRGDKKSINDSSHATNQDRSSTWKEINNKSGHKVKGRGQVRYKPPNSRSGSRDRNTTPEHWHQAAQRTRKISPEDVRRWHEKRFRDQATRLRESDELRKGSQPLPINNADRQSIKRKRKSSSEARNRSPSSSQQANITVIRPEEAVKKITEDHQSESDSQSLYVKGYQREKNGSKRPAAAVVSVSNKRSLIAYSSAEEEEIDNTRSGRHQQKTPSPPPHSASSFQKSVPRDPNEKHATSSAKHNAVWERSPKPRHSPLPSRSRLSPPTRRDKKSSSPDSRRHKRSPPHSRAVDDIKGDHLSSKRKKLTPSPPPPLSTPPDDCRRRSPLRSQTSAHQISPKKSCSPSLEHYRLKKFSTQVPKTSILSPARSMSPSSSASSQVRTPSIDQTSGTKRDILRRQSPQVSPQPASVRGPTSRSRSRSVEHQGRSSSNSRHRRDSRGSRRSPPAHLVKQWRERREQALSKQYRRSGVSNRREVSPSSPPGSQSRRRRHSSSAYSRSQHSASSSHSVSPAPQVDRTAPSSRSSSKRSATPPRDAKASRGAMYDEPPSQATQQAASPIKAAEVRCTATNVQPPSAVSEKVAVESSSKWENSPAAVPSDDEAPHSQEGPNKDREATSPASGPWTTSRWQSDNPGQAVAISPKTQSANKISPVKMTIGTGDAASNIVSSPVAMDMSDDETDKQDTEKNISSNAKQALTQADTKTDLISFPLTDKGQRSRKPISRSDSSESSESSESSSSASSGSSSRSRSQSSRSFRDRSHSRRHQRHCRRSSSRRQSYGRRRGSYSRSPSRRRRRLSSRYSSHFAYPSRGARCAGGGMSTSSWSRTSRGRRSRSISYRGRSRRSTSYSHRRRGSYSASSASSRSSYSRSSSRSRR